MAHRDIMTLMIHDICDIMTFIIHGTCDNIMILMIHGTCDDIMTLICLCLLYLEHLVPLPILDIIICPFLDYYILSMFCSFGSPFSYHTLIFDFMSSRNLYLYNAYIYTCVLFDDPCYM